MFLMLRQKLAGGKARQHAFITRQMRIAGIHPARIGRRIRVAEQRRVVSRPPGRQRQIVEASIERRTVAADPVVHLIETGIERGPRRRAGCRPGIVPSEEGAFARQRIDTRRLYAAMADGRQAIAAPLVRRDQ